MVAVIAATTALDLDNLAADASIALSGAIERAGDYGLVNERSLLDIIERQNAVIVALVEAVKDLQGEFEARDAAQAADEYYASEVRHRRAMGEGLS